MKREDKVISLDTAKKLYELGVRVESEHKWRFLSKRWVANKEECRIPKLLNNREVWECTMYNHASAYDTAELGEMLEENDEYTTWTEHFCGIVYCRASHFKGNEVITERRIEADTEAEAMGKMLIWLLEQKRIKIEDVNKG